MSDEIHWSKCSDAIEFYTKTRTTNKSDKRSNIKSKTETLQTASMNEEKNRIMKKYANADFAKTDTNLERSQETKTKKNAKQKALKVEENEDAKRFLRLVSDVKSHVVRDAQVQEKLMNREKERKENAKFAAELEKNLEIALEIENEKLQDRERLKMIIAENLKNQIEESEKIRTEKQKMEKEKERMLLENKRKKMAEERINFQKNKELDKIAKREECQRINELKEKKRLEDMEKEKTHDKKILREQIKKYRDEDKLKEKMNKEKDEHQIKKEIWLKELEKEMKRKEKEREMRFLQEKEMEERIWRKNVLRKAEEEQKKRAKEKREAAEQLELKRKRKMEEKIKQREYNDSFKSHSIVTEEREKFDKNRSRSAQNIIKRNLETQMEQKMRKNAREINENVTIKKQYNKKLEKEFGAVEDFKMKTIKELEDFGVSTNLLDHLKKKTAT